MHQPNFSTNFMKKRLKGWRTNLVHVKISRTCLEDYDNMKGIRVIAHKREIYVYLGLEFSRVSRELFFFMLCSPLHRSSSFFIILPFLPFNTWNLSSFSKCSWVFWWTRLVLYPLYLFFMKFVENLGWWIWEIWSFILLPWDHV